MDDRNRRRAEDASVPESLHYSGVDKTVLVANLLMAVFYFVAITFWFPVANRGLFIALIIGEIFHVWQVFSYIHTIWRGGSGSKTSFEPAFLPPVDVFITVAGEPENIVEETVAAARDMDYPNFNVHILNDGLVAKKDNWRGIETLAKRLGVNCITREIPGGAKAGNINNALKVTAAPFVAIFDADHVPHKDFLRKMMGYFYDPKVGFVQSPQYYKNRKINYVTGGAWEQQSLFFGPIMMGKNDWNAAYMCGTNMVIRKKAILGVGGMMEDNITEDMATALLMHARGWKSVYIPEVLAEGLAPEDFSSYYKQQSRWTRGSLDALFKYVFTMPGLSWGQRIQYLSSASFFLMGSITLMNALFPLIFLFTGQAPFSVTTMALAAVFLPYMFLTIYVIQLSSNFAFTFRALAFSLSSFWIHITSLFQVLFGRGNNFVVTSKKKVSGDFTKYVIPHLIYYVLAVIGIATGIIREGLNAAVIANMAWVFFNMAIFLPFIVAAMPAGEEETVVFPRARTRPAKAPPNPTF